MFALVALAHALAGGVYEVARAKKEEDAVVIRELPESALLTDRELDTIDEALAYSGATMIPGRGSYESALQRRTADAGSRKGYEAACLQVPCRCPECHGNPVIDTFFCQGKMLCCGGTGKRLLSGPDVARVLAFVLSHSITFAVACTEVDAKKMPEAWTAILAALEAQEAKP